MEEFEFEFETSEEEEEEEEEEDSDDDDAWYPDQDPYPGDPGFRERVSDLAINGKRRAVVKEFISAIVFNLPDAEWMIESGIIELEKDRDRINRELVDDMLETIRIRGDFPRVKFLLDKDLVTEELIREIDRETEWEMVEMIEKNKKGSTLQDLCRIAIRRPGGPCGPKEDSELEFGLEDDRLQFHDKINDSIDQIRYMPETIKRFLKYK